MGNLDDLSVDDLAERLVAIAQRARKLSDEDAGVVLHEMLQEVRTAADSASGEALALLEVAEAFLRALARSDLGKAELALRRLMVEQAETAEAVFSELIDSRHVSVAEIDRLEPDVRARFEALFELGVLRRKADATFDLRPSMRALARDLLEPAVIRMWRRVQNARAVAGASHMREDQAAYFVASQLAVTTQQARSFLRTDPVVGTVPAAFVAEDFGDRMPVPRIVYRRPTRALQAPESLDVEDQVAAPVVAAKARPQQSEGAAADVLSSIAARAQEALN